MQLISRLPSQTCARWVLLWHTVLFSIGRCNLIFKCQCMISYWYRNVDINDACMLHYKILCYILKRLKYFVFKNQDIKWSYIPLAWLRNMSQESWIINFCYNSGHIYGFRRYWFLPRLSSYINIGWVVSLINEMGASDQWFHNSVAMLLFFQEHLIYTYRCWKPASWQYIWYSK